MNKFELRLISSFLLWCFLAVIVMLVGNIAIYLLFNTTINYNGAVMGSIPAMGPGRLYYKRMSALPGPSFSWRMAAYFTVLINVFGFFVLIALYDGTSLLMAVLSDAFAFWFLVFLLLAQFALTRFFFGSAARWEQKRQAKQNSQDQSVR